MSGRNQLNPKKAIEFINRAGALLVFPIKNKKEPRSLWSEFYPRKEMKWEWDGDADDRVAQLWYLMKDLSSRKDVVYSKWHRGRATFFSRPVFTALLAEMRSRGLLEGDLSPSARLLYETLESDSPLSTKQLKKFTELQGRDNEPTYSRGMKQLFSLGYIVACGEVDDGAFPSLSVGATKLIFEDLWEESKTMLAKKKNQILLSAMPEGSDFRKFLDKQNIQSQEF